MLPEKLWENKRWGEHYKYWLKFFNQSKNIVDDIINISEEVDESVLDAYYVDLSRTKEIKHTNPIAFAVVTCNQVDAIIKKAEEDEEFNTTLYNLIFTTFIESKYFIVKENPKWMVNPKLFEHYKNDIDWFGLFHDMLYSLYDTIDYETELFKKYYLEIFDINGTRPAQSGQFWRAVKFGVQFPIEYIYDSVINKTTSFAVDKHNLFYPPIYRYWYTNQLDDFLQIPKFPDFVENVILFMEKMKQHDELCVFITLR